MKLFIKILVVLFLLAAAGIPVSWWIARKLSAPVAYQYLTFRWPAGAKNAFFNFKPGDLYTNDNDIYCQSGPLDKILEAARASAGFAYFSSAGDTVILRRLASAAPSDPPTDRGNLWVIPIPPDPEDFPHLDSRIFGHVKPVK
jgi:hypothetical protein